MEREELIDFLKENLKLDSERTSCYYGSGEDITITLRLCGEELGSVYVSIPRKCEHHEPWI